MASRKWYSGGMEMEQHPELLMVVKAEPIGLMGMKYYAADPSGNV
jgi:hypothetical protein